MKYRISTRADRDIENICDYIAADNPAAADELDRKLHEAVKVLATFPEMGHRRADVNDDRYRFWSVGNYVIAYRAAGSELVVVRVVHGARDFRQLFRRRG